jgi:DNA-binding IclR family transcriptional regulator
MGKAVMAYLPEAELEEALGQQSFQARTENTITDEKTFREHLKLVEARGYATDREENRLTVSCIGAPVFDATGKVMAAISISGPSFRMTPKKMKELSRVVISTAWTISRNLGCQVEITARKIVQRE